MVSTFTGGCLVTSNIFSSLDVAYKLHCYKSSIRVNIAHRKSLKTHDLSPGKPWNLVFFGPVQYWKAVFVYLYERC